jgi:hypothetical protein
MSRYIVLFPFLLTASVYAQTPTDRVFMSVENPGSWNSPYPGIGNVSPGSADGTTTGTVIQQTTTLYGLPEEETTPSELSPTGKGTELYLSRIPNNKRQGFFQKVNFNTLWVPAAGGSKGLGMTELDLAATFALPLPKPESPLIITPSFRSTFFDPKNEYFAPKETFYNTGVDLRWIKPLSPNKFTLDLGFGIFYSGDFKVKTGDAIRFPAHVAGIWNCNPRLKVIFGVVYLDRKDDYNILPMAGLIWTPQEDISVELMVPRLRIAERVRWFGSAAGDDTSDWIYAAFEIAGGSWGYQPVSNMNGDLDYHDFRLLMGYERRTSCGFTLGLELGYMFGRTLEFDRVGYKVHPTDGIFLRLRTSY